MTPDEFKLSIETLADLLALAGSPTEASDLKRLGSVFNASKDKAAAATLKKLLKLKVPTTAPDHSLNRVKALIEASGYFCQRALGTKYSNLLDTLSVIISANENVTPIVFVENAVRLLQAPAGPTTTPPRDVVVKAYLRRLEEALGDAAFIEVHRQLSEDNTVTPAEVIAVGKAFTSKKPASRPKALQAIWSRHNTLMTVRSKSESRAGRSAA